MSDLSQKRMRLELRHTQAAVDDALGYRYEMVLMRPPYGNPYFDGSDALPVFRKVVRDQELFPILWTLDPGDYMLGGRPEDVLRGIVRADETGRKKERDQVLLLHDTHKQTANAIPHIIDHYERSGRQFVTVGELLADKYAPAVDRPLRGAIRDALSINTFMKSSPQIGHSIVSLYTKPSTPLW